MNFFVKHLYEYQKCSIIDLAIFRKLFAKDCKNFTVSAIWSVFAHMMWDWADA